MHQPRGFQSPKARDTLLLTNPAQEIICYCMYLFSFFCICVSKSTRRILCVCVYIIHVYLRAVDISGSAPGQKIIPVLGHFLRHDLREFLHVIYIDASSRVISSCTFMSMYIPSMGLTNPAQELLCFFYVNMYFCI